MATHTGRVSWYSCKKNYGFIRPDGWEHDLFVHKSALKVDGFRALAPDESVQFDITEGRAGPQAARVVRLAG